MTPFREVQKFSENRIARWSAVVTVLVGLAVALTTAAAIVSSGVALDSTLIGAAVLVPLIAAATLLVVFGRMTTEVTPHALRVRVWPLTRQHSFEYASMRACSPRRYRPIREFGGWGVRIARTGKAYNVTGNLGVQLVFRDGKRLLLGTQRPEALATAIREAARGRGVELREAN